MLMFYYMKKEIIDSKKYKDQLIRGKYANNFSGLDLTHYDCASTDYWRQMLLYIHDETATAPWHAACWERYEIPPEYAKRNNRSMARSEGGPNLSEDLSTKGRKKLLDEGPRVKLGFVATPERGNIPTTDRAARAESNVGIFLPALLQRAQQEEDQPSGSREAWPAGNWGRSQSRALTNLNARWAGDAGQQEMRRVVICEQEVASEALTGLNDPEGMIGAFHRPMGDHDKWTHPSRYWYGYDLFDTETPIRKGGDPTITLGHREGNDTMRLFYRGALMGMMIEKLRSLLHETMIIYIRNSLPDLRTYLLQNIEGIHTMDDAVKWSEHFEHAQLKTSAMKVSSLKPVGGMEEIHEWQDEGGEITQSVDAFGRQTGRNFSRRRNNRGGSSTGRFRRIQDVGFRSPSLPPENQPGGEARGSRNNGSMGISQCGPSGVNRGHQQQQGNCHGCGQPGHFVRRCPKISSINGGGGNNRSYGGYFGGRFQSFRGGSPKGGRWIKIRRDFGNGRPNAISAIEDNEDELVWQEDDEEEYVESLEDNFQQISVVEEVENQYDSTQNHYDSTVEDEQYVQDVTM